jgi:TetR/AcrR family transcriptional regulator, repressor for neighboring sulfatase
VSGSAPRRSRADVEQAIIDSYLTIAARDGMKAATTRRVAEAAGVNAGLIHRYFGSRRALMGRLLDELVQRVSAQFETDFDLGPTGALALYTKVLISAADEGLDPSELQSSHPVVERLAVLGEQLGVEIDAARLVAAQIFSLYLGWEAFGAFASQIAGVAPRSPEDQAHELRRAARVLAMDAIDRSKQVGLDELDAELRPTITDP